MGDRRMISRKIVDSARFLKMPATSQNLYFHLIVNADDDGVVEAYRVINAELLEGGMAGEDGRILRGD